MSKSAADIYFCGAGTPIDDARVVIAQLEQRHQRGEHFWRWTGRTLETRQVLRCMFCPQHRVAEPSPAVASSTA